MSDVWNKSSLRALTLPGGVVVLVAAVLAHTGWAALPGPSLNFMLYCALLGGVLLAWRFHSCRIFLGLVIVYLARVAMGLLAPSHTRTLLDNGMVANSIAVLGVLIPMNFALIGIMQERGFTLPGVAPPLLFLFVQTVFVTVLASDAGGRTRHGTSMDVPNYVFAAFGTAGLVLAIRTIRSQRPADNALLWSLAACFLSLYFHSAARVSAIYSIAAMAILVISIVETSYLFAYHDELTGLPSRRAFNDALHALQPPYSIAAVDIDHFKNFNDTYGHETGDQVLRLVASKLARVAGGGHAYRCGGEEFTILFPGRLTADVVSHLEQLRIAIENAEFRMRGSERRQTPRGPDRRSGENRNRGRKAEAIRQLALKQSKEFISVTVSIGVASCSSGTGLTERVIQAADKALYRAKANGRNRVEMAASGRSRKTKAAGIA